MAHTRLITLNASSGAFTAVSATTVTRRVEIIEDGSANGGTRAPVRWAQAPSSSGAGRPAGTEYTS